MKENKKIIIKKVKNKNKKSNVSLKKQEKLSSKKTFKLIVIIIISILLLIVLSFAILYNLLNKKIYDKIINSSEEIVNIDYKYKNLILWDKTIEYIKNNNKKIYINCGEYSYLLNNEKLSKYISFKANIKNNITNIDEFSNYSNVYVNISNNSDAVEALFINVDRNVFINDFIDIYTHFDNNYSIYKSAEKIDSNKVKIELLDKNYNEFLIVYIPVTKLEVLNKEFNIKRGMTEEFDIKIEPENATNKNIYFETSDINVASVAGNKIQTGIAGQANIKVKINNESVEENLTVNVLEILNEIKLSRTNVSLYVGGNINITATLLPENAVNKDLEWSSSDDNIASVENGKITAKKLGKCTINVRNTSEPIIENQINVSVIEKPNYPSPGGSQNANLTYINGILIVNKKYSVPSTYSPGVNPTAYNAYIALKNAANAAGFSMPLISGYRSYQTQTNLYNRYVAQYGEKVANTFSAKPGQSEHQTGLAFDVGSIDNNYGQTAAGKWLAENAHRFGFIIRYPKGKEAITGYQYEPWHIRYLGTDIATDVYNKGVCLEEYLGIA